jgi:hypothetical protein
MASVGDAFEVDPAILRISPSRPQGADPTRLQLRISQFGRSRDGMPPLELGLAIDGELVIMDGMTRATRIAKLVPGTTVPAKITEKLNYKGRRLPTIGECLP